MTLSSNNALQDLKKAKAYSDAKQYEQKHLLMHELIKQNMKDFVLDSDDGSNIVGITHTPTGFQMHLPKNVIADLNISKAKTISKLSTVALRPGEGLLQTGTQRAPSQFGTLKTKIKKDTLGKNNVPKSRFAQMCPATQEFIDKRTRTNSGMINKRAEFVSGTAKYLGYRPGVWYSDKDDVSYDNRMRFGNMVSGLGLSGLGLASIPLLQYLFPERFKNKGTALSIAAIAGGLATPWIVNFPHTFSELGRLKNKSNNDYTEADRNNLQKGISNGASNLDRYPADSSEPNVEKQGFVSLGTPIPKMHLADVASEQLQSGYVDYGQAAGLMLAANRASPRPWFTVGDLARAAIGAGAGAIAGTAAAKGIGLFMNLKPNEQKIMQGTGAALGTLINLGKLSI
jgi:hypothetical protein